MFLRCTRCFDSKDLSDLRTVKPLGLKGFFISQDIIVPGRPLAYCSGRFILRVKKTFGEDLYRRTLIV